MPDAVPTATDTDSDLVWKWTVRAMYATAIGLNLYLMWDQVKDTAEVELLRRRFRRGLANAIAPLTDRRILRRHTNAVIFEATQIVEATHNA
jgi:hypothetical protein